MVNNDHGEEKGFGYINGEPLAFLAPASMICVLDCSMLTHYIL